MYDFWGQSNLCCAGASISKVIRSAFKKNGMLLPCKMWSEDMHVVSIRVQYGYRWHSDKLYVLIWFVRVPSKPISHENGCPMYFLTQNTFKFKFLKKEKLI